jgi:tripartite-type tricarboxylate transporter receptor subunit TctC
MKRLLGALLAASLFAIPAKAADPIKIVVPFAAGGPVDALARILAQELAPRLASDVVVENRGGAGRWRAHPPTDAPFCSRAPAPS